MSRIVSSYRSERSLNGYQLDVLKSGLQKWIRRGVNDKALYCAGELDLFKLSEERGEAIRTNFVHRLMVVFVEDIGVAGLSIWPEVDKYIQTILREPRDSMLSMLEYESVVHVVNLLCDCEKARLNSHIRLVSQPIMSTQKHNVLAALSADEVAVILRLWHDLDMHRSLYKDASLTTLSEKFKSALVNREWDAFWWATEIAASAEKVCYRKKRRAVWRIFEILENFVPKSLLDIACRWFDEMSNLQESFCVWGTLICGVVLGAIEDATPRPTSPNATLADQNAARVTLDAMRDVWPANVRGDTIEFDSYIIDKHTSKGRRAGASTRDFALIGSYVENESAYVVLAFKKVYNAIRGA